MPDRSSICYDALTEFSLGMNSGKDPFLLAKNQLSNAFNSTVRGDFVTNRPPFQIQTLQFTGSIQTAATTGLFQGVGYYSPDTGSQMMIAQIGGRLFTFTPAISGSTIQVAEVSIPGDYNDPNLSQAWLRQAEKWMVVNNGVSNPIFFDGISSRRSDPVGSLLGTSSPATFGTPAVGSPVTVALAGSAAFDGSIGQNVLLVELDTDRPPNVVATSNYLVVAGGNTFNYFVTAINLNDPAGTAHNNSTALIVQPTNLGVFTPTSNPVITGTSGGITVYQRNGVLSSPLPAYVTAAGPAPYYTPAGSSITIANDSQPYSWEILSIDATRKIVTLATSWAGSIVTQTTPSAATLLNYNKPAVTIATLAQGFSAPTIGMAIQMQVSAEFTYPAGTVMFIDNGQYQVVSAQTQAAGAGAGNVTLQNLDDGRTNHTFNLTGYTQTQIWSIPELPPGRMGDYGMGRIWMSLPNGINFIAGDIVGGPSGTPAYNYRDAVLKVSENQLLAGGGYFSVPSNLGLINAMRFTSQLDASLGQGPLMVSTPGGVFSCNAPTDRTTWQSLTNPILSESLIGFGGTGQDSTVVINGDLIMRSPDGLRSLLMARRDFWSWGNTPISFEVQPILNSDDPNGVPFESSVQFDNRMLVACTPVQQGGQWYFTNIIALNFDPLSSLQGKENSVYDGVWSGPNIIKMISNVFNGVTRCFAFCFNTTTSTIEVHELLPTANPSNLDDGATPIQWSFMTPMLFNTAGEKGFFDLCTLEDGEFYVSGVTPGQPVQFTVSYRSDYTTTWTQWHSFTLPAPASPNAEQGVRLGLGRPPSGIGNNSNSTATSSGRWFQLQFVITGSCVFKGLRVAVSRQPQTEFARPIPGDGITDTERDSVGDGG